MAVRIADWDEYFIRMAMLAASKSKDDSCKVGVVLVLDNSIISTGYNGFPQGVAETYGQLCTSVPLDSDKLNRLDDLIEERWHQRPDKYRWVEHAERNAIYQAARLGHATEGASLYMNTAGQPCSDCMRACIQAGICEIVVRDIGTGFLGKGEGTHYHCGDIEQTMREEAGLHHRTIRDFAPDYRYTAPFSEI